MIHLSAHFDRKEFACKCGCGFDTIDIETLDVLEMIRLHFGKPVRITSGCRCHNHNRKVGGSEKSQHVFGRAADIQVVDIEPSQVYGFLQEQFPRKYGLGLYQSWIHVDTRSNGPARWKV